LRTRLEISGITIAIDELDKFADPVQAHEFVNEVKTVFGVNSCVFLVSVSDDALASFERRGIPVRDALDSAFAAMIAVAPFSLRECYDWLDRRLAGLPSPFACLCYCFAAGVPRELERAKATLMDMYIEHERKEEIALGERGDLPELRYRQLAEVTHTIIAADTAAKRQVVRQRWLAGLPASPHVLCGQSRRWSSGCGAVAVLVVGQGGRVRELYAGGWLSACRSPRFGSFRG